MVKGGWKNSINKKHITKPAAISQQPIRLGGHQFNIFYLQLSIRRGGAIKRSKVERCSYKPSQWLKGGGKNSINKKHITKPVAINQKPIRLGGHQFNIFYLQLSIRRGGAIKRSKVERFSYKPSQWLKGGGKTPLTKNI